MHVEAHAGFGRALQHSLLDPQGRWSILDIGGQNVNGSVHSYFPNATITTLDVEHADIIADARTWQPDRLFDVVITTETFEHVPEWERIVTTARRALDPHGPGVLLVTCASTGRRPHGATGTEYPAAGEYYENVPAATLERVLGQDFADCGVEFQVWPGDAYAWASLRPTARLPAITVVIPTIAPRGGRQPMLEKALASVAEQTYPATAVVTETAGPREGPAAVRNRALTKVETDWVAFLDDDDYLLPDHLATLAQAQARTGADVLWPWFQVEGGRDPFPGHRGAQWNPAQPHQIPITTLVRTAAIRTVGGFHPIGEGPTDPDGHRAGEDWHLWLALSAEGYQFHHVDAVTWVWRHHGKNTSGLPGRV